MNEFEDNIIMKQILSERVFLNMAGKESSQTVRLTPITDYRKNI